MNKECSFIVRICVFGLYLGNPWVIEGEAGVKTTCLPSQRPLRQRRKERRVVVMGVVCLINLMGKDYSTGGVPPIGSLWRISWLAFKTWSSIWAAPASKGRQQEYTCGFGLLKEWSCHPDMLPDSSSLQPRNGLEGWCLLSLLGFGTRRGQC